MSPLPNLGMDFTPFDTLPAASLDDLVENIEALAAGTGLNDKVVTSRKTQLTIVGADGTTLNPIPTSVTDIASSSVTFTCNVASYLFVTLTGRIQTNGSSVASVYLNVDGVLQGRDLTQNNVNTQAIHVTNSRTFRVALTAASHTIKLQAVAGSAAATVVYDPSWWGMLVAQP